jgi:type I restriction enzyme M protein
MLDKQTKRRIDDCRDILVGKLPDPKAQIEQITIGLIYKFMDDMDKEAVELGGQAKFFSDYKVPDPEFPNDRNKDKVIEFSKYAWDKLMHPKVTANEMLTLYLEAIEGMEKNPNIPQLFRDIFNNAYLPYRDPETLKMFLKTIGEFEYTHSEKLGDAFEYLLSVMGSQGDAGQFRTPRHIIDFLVAIVDPDKTNSILDPACGTAGFLISAYKHILLKNSKENRLGLDIYEYNKLEKKPFNNLGDQLTPDDRKNLIQNFTGYDISPDMVRLSLVNLYLHGFNTPNIHEYDTLSSEERWNENFDVVLANPPFMSPKGGIRPHKKFTVQANKAEVLFTNYISEHLNVDGRAAIIIPNGVVSNGQTAFKQVRTELVNQNLIAVISLPSGVFNPYSPIKTSALILDKKLSNKTSDVLFIEIENDGYDLGAQRRPISRDDLPEALKVFNVFKEIIEEKKQIELSDFGIKTLLVDKSIILSEKDVALVSNRYGESKELNSKYDVVPLGDVLDYEQPTPYIVSSVDYDDTYPTPVLTAGKTFILGYTDEKHGILNKDLPVIIFDDFTTATKLVDFPFKVKSSAMKILHVKKDLADVEYVYHVMQNIDFDSTEHKRYWISQYSKILIPLPPLDVQKQIVNQIKAVKSKIEEHESIIEDLKTNIKGIINDAWGLE